MNLMNKVSIKSKLLLLVVFPLCFCSWLALIELSELHSKAHSLNMISARVKVADELSHLTFNTHQIKVNWLKHEDVDQDRQQLSGTFVALKEHIDAAFDYPHNLEMRQVVDEMESLLQDFDGVGEGDIISWGNWMSDLNAQAYMLLESWGAHSHILGMESLLTALYQLKWFHFWAEMDNWYANLLYYRQINDDTIDQRLWTAREKQRFYIERFLSLYATPDQIELLQDSFFHPVFTQYSQPSIDVYPLEDMAGNLANYEQRFRQVQFVTDEINSQLAEEIAALAQAVRGKIVMIFSGIVMALIVMCVLGWNIATRCISALNRILTTLETVESDRQPHQDYRISVDGNDEFTVFFRQLNTLLEERQFNQEKLLRAKEAAERANLAKSSFLANMSHEIRTPLNGMIGMSELLTETELSAVQREYLSTIETSSQTLLLLINDILDLSKIESGNLVLVPTATDICEVVYETASIILQRVNETGLMLDIRLDPAIPHYVELDEHRLRQVLMNLAANAVKFTTEGKVTIQVISQPVAEGKVRLQFLVEDTGIGIEQGNHKKVFAPFIQEDGTITRRYGGTGLGLAICRQLVEMMGGEMTLVSEKGVGSRFSFHLTVDLAAEQPPAVPEATGLRCLLLGDDPDVAERLGIEMRRWGMSTVHASALSPATDLSGYQCVILFSFSYAQLRQNISRLRELAPSLALVTCYQHDEKYQDIDLSIDGLVVQPLLGQRLVKTVLSAIEHAKDRSLVDPGPIEPSRAETTYDLVLVAEDSPVNQRVAALFLEKAGFDFDLVDNGQAALEAVMAGKPYRAVLMDCMMPVMDGLAATRAIRDWEQEVNAVRKLPIIAVTASVLDEDIQECFDAGMDDYVAKPYRKEVLIEKLKALK